MWDVSSPSSPLHPPPYPAPSLSPSQPGGPGVAGSASSAAVPGAGRLNHGRQPLTSLPSSSELAQLSRQARVTDFCSGEELQQACCLCPKCNITGCRYVQTALKYPHLCPGPNISHFFCMKLMDFLVWAARHRGLGLT